MIPVIEWLCSKTFRARIEDPRVDVTRVPQPNNFVNRSTISVLVFGQVGVFGDFAIPRQIYLIYRTTIETAIVFVFFSLLKEKVKFSYIFRTIVFSPS